MIYPTHGYIDILNYELQHGNSNKFKLVTKSNDIIFQDNNASNYNSKEFVNRILEKVLSDLNSHNDVYKNILLKKSVLKLTPKHQPYDGSSSHQYKLEIKLRPSEDTAHIFIDDFSIIATFKNEISCIRQDYIMKRQVRIDETCNKLITIPQHGLQISLNHCSSYNNFKTIMQNALYEDISSLMINKLKGINLPKWSIDLDATNLDIENIINDNIKILIA